MAEEATPKVVSNEDALKEFEAAGKAQGYSYKSAGEVVREGVADTGEWARAEEAGVVHPAYVDYEEALQNYEDRPDVEPLALRRARESGVKFSDAEFRRKLGDDEGSPEGGLVTSAKAAGTADASPAEEKKDDDASKNDQAAKKAAAKK